MRTADQAGKFFHFDNNFWNAPMPCGFLDLYQLGELCYERGFRAEEHEQTVCEVSCILSGSGFATVNGARVPLLEGDVLVNSIGSRHAMEAGCSDILRFTYMGFRFRGDAPEELRAVYDSAPYRLVRDKSDLLFPFMRCMDEFYASTAFSRPMIRGYCEQIVILAARDFAGEGKAGAQRVPRPNPVSSAVYSVIRYVDEHICEFGSIRELAGTLGYNYTYLSHFFRDKTGVTLQNYIAYKKIERALQLLRYGELRPSQIAERLRYESVQTFSKAFRRVMGYPPTRYRDRQESALPPDPLFAGASSRRTAGPPKTVL